MPTKNKTLKSLITAPEPAKVIALLESAGGDVSLLLHGMTGDNGLHQRLLANILFQLSVPGNEQYKRQWHKLIASFEEAKILLTRSKALEFISGYKLPACRRATPNNLPGYVTFAKFWLSASNAGEIEKAKHKAKRQAPQSDTEEDGLKQLLANMQAEQDT